MGKFSTTRDGATRRSVAFADASQGIGASHFTKRTNTDTMTKGTMTKGTMTGDTMTTTAPLRSSGMRSLNAPVHSLLTRIVALVAVLCCAVLPLGGCSVERNTSTDDFTKTMKAHDMTSMDLGTKCSDSGMDSGLSSIFTSSKMHVSGCSIAYSGSSETGAAMLMMQLQFSDTIDMSKSIKNIHDDYDSDAQNMTDVPNGVEFQDDSVWYGVYLQKRSALIAATDSEDKSQMQQIAHEMHYGVDPGISPVALWGSVIGAVFLLLILLLVARSASRKRHEAAVMTSAYEQQGILQQYNANPDGLPVMQTGMSYAPDGSVVPAMDMAAPMGAAGAAGATGAPNAQGPYAQAPYGQVPSGQAAPYRQAPYGQASYGQMAYGQSGAQMYRQPGAQPGYPQQYAQPAGQPQSGFAQQGQQFGQPQQQQQFQTGQPLPGQMPEHAQYRPMPAGQQGYPQQGFQRSPYQQQVPQQYQQRYQPQPYAQQSSAQQFYAQQPGAPIQAPQQPYQSAHVGVDSATAQYAAAAPNSVAAQGDIAASAETTQNVVAQPATQSTDTTPAPNPATQLTDTTSAPTSDTTSPLATASASTPVSNPAAVPAVNPDAGSDGNPTAGTDADPSSR